MEDEVLSSDDTSILQESPTADKFEYLKSKVLPPDEYEEVGCSYFNWEISDYWKLESMIPSPVFTIGGHPWRILLFPLGKLTYKWVGFILKLIDDLIYTSMNLG